MAKRVYPKSKRATTDPLATVCSNLAKLTERSEAHEAEMRSRFDSTCSDSKAFTEKWQAVVDRQPSIAELIEQERIEEELEQERNRERAAVIAKHAEMTARYYAAIEHFEGLVQILAGALAPAEAVEDAEAREENRAVSQAASIVASAAAQFALLRELDKDE